MRPDIAESSIGLFYILPLDNFSVCHLSQFHTEGHGGTIRRTAILNAANRIHSASNAAILSEGLIESPTSLSPTRGGSSFFSAANIQELDSPLSISSVSVVYPIATIGD